MAQLLAVSDAQQNLVILLSLPDLEPLAQTNAIRAPGRLAAFDRLYCAHRTDPAVSVFAKGSLVPAATFAAGPEIEALSISEDGSALYALSGGANCLQMLDAKTGALLRSANAGLCPRSAALLPGAEVLAVADGINCQIVLLAAGTLDLLAAYRTDSITCSATWFAGSLYALCAEGEYDLRTIIGRIDRSGKWTPQIALPGLPGTMTPCGGGLLVGHLGWLTMLDAPNARIRWQTRIGGLPTQLLPLGHFACYADETDGFVGLVDVRQGKILRRIQLDCPSGLAAL